MTFEEFASVRLPGLLRYAVLLTGDEHLAEDLVQNVLVRAHRRWRRIAELDRPELYLRRMVTNEVLSWRRLRWVRSTVVTDPGLLDHPLTGDHASRQADRDEMWRRLAALPPRQRAVLALRYYEGLPDETIAEVLGCAPSTVRAHASRALAALRIDIAGGVPAGEERR